MPLDRLDHSSLGLPRLREIATSLLAGVAMVTGCATAPVPQQPDQERGPEVALTATQFSTIQRAAIPAPAKRIALRIDETITYQTIEGFGATITEHFDLVSREDQMGTLRPRVIDAVFGQVRITMGHLDVGPYENFDASRYTTANDDGDPFTTNWSAFNFVRSDSQYAGIVALARPYGFDNFTIHSGTNVRWSDPWMAAVRKSNYRLYLEEMAENVVVPLIYWRDKFGIVTRWHHLFNEPTTGNRELDGGGIREVVDLVKVVGARLRREGFGDMRLVVASEETEEASLASARAILADPEARQYVGAISYHTYPYGSIYSEVNRILATSGQGQPDAGRIKVRNQIRDLAKQYGLQVWMTEVSHGRAGPQDSLRGRAIHVHDELRYAGASSYWAMFQAWNVHAERGTCDEDCLVFFNRARGTVSITGTGYAIGHYARWIRRGAVRIDAESDDPLVQVSAFRDDTQKRMILVVINNNRDAVAVDLQAAGQVALSADFRGEQSSADGYWIPLTPASPPEGSNIAIQLPPRSVTSLSVGFR